MLPSSIITRNIITLKPNPSTNSRLFHTTKAFRMPLVVPGINSGGDNSKTQDWMNKLVGKKIGEGSDATTFAKKDLPEQHRIIKPGQMVTKDFNENRLNIHVGDDGNVTHVDHQ